MPQQPHSVAKRTVFYLEGYDPRGPAHYHALYRDEAAKQAAVSGLDLTVGPRRKLDAIQSMWTVTSPATETSYIFLRYDDIMRARWSKTNRAIFWDIARYTWAFLTRGVYGGMWRHFKPILFFATAAPALVVIALLLAAGAGYLAGSYTHPAIGIAVSVALLILFLVARPLVEKALATFWIARICAFSADQGAGRTPDMDMRIGEFAGRIGAELQSGSADEVLVVGHSIGSQIGVEVLARVLENFASPEIRLAFLTLGQTIPLVGFQPPAHGFRHDLLLIAADPRLDWVDVSARADGLCFPLIDPLMVCGLTQPDPANPKPRLVSARYHTLFTPDTYRKIKRDFYRTHFQYLMAAERPGDYDYFLITAGDQRLATRFGKPSGTTTPTIATAPRP